MDADDPLEEPAAALARCRRFRSNLPLYASCEDLGVPRDEMRRHLADCPACLRELEAYRRQHRLLRDYGQAIRRVTPGEAPAIWSGLEGCLPRPHGPWRGPPAATQRPPEGA